jgi:alkanesulfonate monooxygenase SsuD/methylene tetrahydromethanopterin reductase-like flavin-dependent oxidoreductase (luciferase family)
MVTSRVRLGTMVTPVARRRPWVLARQVATVDHLSAGRAVLGVGLGIPADLEYGALGEPVEAALHAARLDEGLAVIDRLWSGERVTHAGPHYRVDDLVFRPAPIQRPRVPIWSAAALPARAGVRRAARWDGVAPIYIDGNDLRPVTPDEVAGVVAEVRELRPADAPFDVVVWAVAPDEPLRRAYAEAGATWLIEGPAQVPDWIGDAVRIAAAGPPPDPAMS